MDFSFSRSFIRSPRLHQKLQLTFFHHPSFPLVSLQPLSTPPTSSVSLPVSLSRARALCLLSSTTNPFFTHTHTQTQTQTNQNTSTTHPTGKKALAIAQAGADYDPAVYASKVDAAIASAKGKTMVFSWSGCPFCKKAKALLDAKGAKYTALELDQMEDGQKYRAALAEKTGRTSMPNIFIDGVGIGGFGDGSPGLKPLSDAGELEGRLRAAGAL